MGYKTVTSLIFRGKPLQALISEQRDFKMNPKTGEISLCFHFAVRSLAVAFSTNYISENTALPTLACKELQ